MIRPLLNRVLIKFKEDRTEEQSGILLPDIAQPKIRYGTVIDTGEDVTCVTEGDCVIIPKGELIEIPVENELYTIIFDHEIVGVV